MMPSLSPFKTIKWEPQSLNAAAGAHSTYRPSFEPSSAGAGSTLWVEIPVHANACAPIYNPLTVYVTL